MNYRLSRKFLLITGAVLVGIITGCAPNTSAPILQSRPQATDDASVVRIALDTAPSTPVIAPFTDYACLDCHTDQEQLTALAVEDKVTESLSEGPG